MKANPNVFKENFHMSVSQFNTLLGLLKKRMEPGNKARKSDQICAEEKLCVTLE